MKALIIIVKSPSVRIVIGKVNKISNGFKKRLKIPSTKATHNAIQKLATCTPGTMYEAIIITSALANQLSRTLIQISIPNLKLIPQNLIGDLMVIQHF